MIWIIQKHLLKAYRIIKEYEKNIFLFYSLKKLDNANFSIDFINKWVYNVASQLRLTNKEDEAYE